MEAETVGEGSVDIGGLRGDFQLLVLGHRVQGAHVVQTVAEFDEHHADVVRQRGDDLLEILCLCALGTFHVGELGEAVHHAFHLFAEHLLDVVEGVFRVFHHVVQQGTNDRGAA